MAERRFFNLEKKLLRSSNLRDEDIGFMREYEDLEHMTKISNDTGWRTSYYLPHHAVVKESSTTTKVHVVFDGSAKSTSGISINDAQLIGPVCKGIYFDNGTSFVGTRNEMQKIKGFLKANHQVISKYAVIEDVDWYFIPPHAPHFGGLWERSVRSCCGERTVNVRQTPF
ncbi:hypothetical protein QLX08_009221 [Tetragonisca angustula]|uniref:Uncharacterized protein n=1 Tax=Tetragonisca angustula TaxID=166442 RepID=A0AAW0ZHQ1_9HYME